MPEQVARLADALRRLAANMPEQPAIVPAVDAGLEGTTAYLATEYVAAETLDVSLRHLAPAPLDIALPILARMAAAIDAAWASSAGHGALHPRDVFVTADAQDVRITGFGVVPALESVGIKTPIRRPYTAPERAAGEPWDVRADVFSLGAIAHELLTRRRPAASGEQDGALTTGTTAEQRVQIRRVLSTVLSERPKHRFPSACAFTDALAAIARSEPVVWPAADSVEIQPPSAQPISAAPRDSAPVEPAARSLPLSDARPEPAPEPVSLAAPAAEPLGAPASSVGTGAPVAVAASGAAAESSDRPRSRDVEQSAAEPPALRVEPVQSFGLEDDAPEEALPLRGPLFGRTFDAPSAPAPRPELNRDASSFPWTAIGAVAAAGIVVGMLIGYQVGVRHAAIQAGPATTAAAAAAETEVPVPPAEPAVATPPPVAAAEPDAAPVVRAAERKGRVIVRSSPPGAMIVIDGRPHGQTPATVNDLALGAHRIEVARSGYVPYTDTVTLAGRNPVRTLSVRLQAGLGSGESAGGVATASGAGSLYVDSRPRQAQVLVDGRLIGTTPLRIPEVRAGAHGVRLQLAGHQLFTTQVSVKAGEEARVTAALEEK